jgi:guanylate kinase
MKKLFVIIGESGSGKTTLVNKLTKKHPDIFKKVVTYTSRLPRSQEIDGIDYHFLPATFFINNTDLVLVKKTKQGDYYGTKKADLLSNSHHLLLTSKPTGVQKLVDLGFKNIVVVRIEISKALKIKRMRQRGDSENMIFERLKSDNPNSTETDFKNMLVIELNAIQFLNKKVKQILEAC